MLPTLYLYITLAADGVIFLFALYYLLKFRRKEKTIEKKEHMLDSNYHHIMDDALAKERQILEDAAGQADKILLNANFTTQDTQEAIQKAMQQMIQHMQRESITTAVQFMNTYSETLKKLSATSLTDFQNIAKSLEGDMQKQVMDFRQTILPNLEKDLESYKATRLKQSEVIIAQIVQKVAQEVLNKTLSMDEHQKLVIDALEKAKAEGVFS